jgi:hypothetical protein
LIIGEFIDVRSQSTSFVHAISVVNRWFEIAAHHHDARLATATATSTTASGNRTAAIAVVPRDQNFRAKCGYQRNGPSAGDAPDELF